MPTAWNNGEDGWSAEVDVPVEFGTRRVSYVPMPDGRLTVLDTTGGGSYGVLLLGELIPVDPLNEARPRRYRAHNHQGDEVGEGNQFNLMEQLFQNHPLRKALLAHGVFRRDNL